MSARPIRFGLGRFRSASGLNPVLVRELRGRFRGPRAFAVVSGFIAICALAVWMLGTLQQAAGGIRPYSPVRTLEILNQINLIELVAIVLLAPGLTAGAISGEIERRTLDLLLATPLGAARIVLGKYLAAVAYLILLISTMLPGLSLVFILGGVSVATFIGSQLVVLSVGLGLAAVGLAASSLSTSTTRSTILAYLSAGVFSIGPFVLGFLPERIFPQSRFASAFQEMIVVASPLMLVVNTDGSAIDFVQTLVLQAWLIVLMLGFAARRLHAGRSLGKIGAWPRRMALIFILWLVWRIGWSSIDF